LTSRSLFIFNFRMKRFAKNITLFLLPFVVFMIVVEVLISRSRGELLSERNLERSFACIKEKYAWFDKIPGKNKVIIVGSSTLRYGICTDILNRLANDTEQFVNLALNAREPLETYFLLKNLDLKNVKAVYMGLDPWMYTKHYYMGRSYSFIVNSLYFDYSQAELFRCFVDHDKSIYQKQVIELFHYYFPPKPERCVANDSMPADIGCVKWDYGQLEMNGPVDDLYQIDMYGWSKLQFTYLMKIAALCKDRGIEFNAVIPPKRADYCAYYKAHSNEIHKGYIENLVAVHFNSPIYGSFDQLKDYKGPDLFEDHYHLNEKGQEVYSRAFWEMIHQPKVNFTADYKWLQN